MTPLDRVPPIIPKSGAFGVTWPAIPGRRDAVLLALQFQLAQTEWWPPEILLTHQLRQAQHLIDHAARTVPFYRDRLGVAVGLGPGVLTPDRFRRVPILRRADVQRAGEELLSRAVPSDHGRVAPYRTSGSTGSPVHGRRTQLGGLLQAALGLRYHLWHRRDLSAKNVTIKTIAGDGVDLSRPHAWAFGFATGPGWVYDISQPVGVLLDRLLADDPAYLQTHPSALAGMIKRSREIGRTPRRLREVRAFGEVVDDALRDLCRRAWGVPLVDNYSSEEAGIVALQCHGHAQYHVQAESVLVEIVDDGDRPCIEPGQVGRVVVTTLHNFAAPLIRYELGDLAEVGGPCPCGRGLPVLRRVLGRVRNLVALPGGDRLHPVFDEAAILAVAPAIRQYQLVQRTLEEIEVRLAARRPLTEEEEEGLRRHFARTFRHGFDLRFVYLDEIPPTAPGKYEVFRSEVSA